MKSPKNRISRSLSSELVGKSVKAFVVPLILSLVISSNSFAQEVWGTTNGGENGTGAIFKIDSAGTEPILFPFSGSNGSNNDGYSSLTNQVKLLRASNGKIYGTTLGGGTWNEGILFEYDPITKETITIVNFSYYDYGLPIGDLVEFNGKLYGNTYDWANRIFSVDLNTRQFEFDYILPTYCRGFILVNDKFYGMTTNGGQKRAGAIFEYNPISKTYKVLFQFDHFATGRYPDAGLTYVDGKLYGLTASGGKYGEGTLFEFNLSNLHFEKKIDFKRNINGRTPTSNLSHYNGKLMGITSAGGTNDQGVLFEYNIASGTLKKLMDFSEENPGGNFEIINGKVFGSSTLGQVPGILYSFDLENKTYEKLITLTKDSGSRPFGRQLVESDNLMGMTMHGGLGNGGVIYEYNTLTKVYQVVHSFDYYPGGRNPSTMIEVGNKFYGTTQNGGTFGGGTLFQFDPETSGLNVVKNFECENCDTYGGYAKLIAVDEKLYGVVSRGNYSSRKDELFEFDLKQQSFTTLYKFDNLAMGTRPISLEYLNGKLFGSTSEGGNFSRGVLFEYEIATASFNKRLDLNFSTTGLLHNLFTINDAIFSISNYFYPNRISQFNADLNTFQTEYNFQDVANPIANVAKRFSKVYGVTRDDGNNSRGTIFEFDVNTGQYRKIHDFIDHPSTSLTIQGRKLYGAILISGGNGETQIYEFDLGQLAFKEIGTLNLNLIESSYNNEITSLFAKTPPVICQPIAVGNELVEFYQGNRKDGKAIDLAMSNPQLSLGFEDSFDDSRNGIRFVSLGFGGVITVGLDQPLCSSSEVNLKIFETNYGNTSFGKYPEQAEVFVSQDGSEWVPLGVTNTSNPEVDCQAKLDTEFSLTSTGYDWIRYVKVVDITDPFAKLRSETTCVEINTYAFNNAANGFDLDAISSVESSDHNNNLARNKQPIMVHIDPSATTASIYPNPVGDELRIDLSEEVELALMDDEFHLEVLDIQGRKWLNSSDALDETWTLKHDVSSLANGIYIARVKNGNVSRYYKFLKK